MNTDTAKHISACEARIKDYKQLMGGLHKSKSLFSEENFEWYKDTLRYWKNLEEADLKKMVIERQHEKQGLNPPYCYWEEKCL